jgi:hypothetical protein
MECRRVCTGQKHRREHRQNPYKSVCVVSVCTDRGDASTASNHTGPWINNHTGRHSHLACRPYV